MKRYQEYVDQVGVPEFPQKQYVWVAYKNGNVAGQATSREGAESQYKTKLVEKVQRNVEEYDRLLEEYKARSAEAKRLWEADFRAEWGELSDEVFNLCYDQAWEDGHSAGYDEVANCMYGVAEFAEKIMKAVKK